MKKFAYITQQFRSEKNNFENVSEKVLHYFIRPRTQNSLIEPKF